MEQMMEGLNKVMHGEPRRRKSCVSWQMISTFSTPPLSVSGANAKRGTGRRRVAPLGEIIEMSLNLEQASDIVERMGVKLPTNRWLQGEHFRLMV